MRSFSLPFMSFTRGELSPRLHARTDMAQYGTGLRTLHNFIVLPQGGVARRPGLERIVDLGPDTDVRLIPFVYGVGDTACVVLDHQRIRIYGREGALLKTIDSPYTMGDIRSVKFTQSLDVVFLAHWRHPPMMLERHDTHDWRLVEFEYRNGPFQDENITDTTMQAANLAVAGEQTTIISSEDFFADGHLGALIKLMHKNEEESIEGEVPVGTEEFVSDPIECKGKWFLDTKNNYIAQISVERSFDNGKKWLRVDKWDKDVPVNGLLIVSGTEEEDEVLYRVKIQNVMQRNVWWELRVQSSIRTSIARISEIVSPTIARAIALTRFKGASPTKFWALGAWNVHSGFPSVVEFYQDRLCFASTLKEPSTVWMSATGDYSNFKISQPIKDDDAITLVPAGRESVKIQSLVALSDLLLMSDASEWRVSGSGENRAITPTGVVLSKQGERGSAAIDPIVIGNRVLFVQARHGSVRDLGYALESDGYSGGEISIMSEHLLRGNEVRAWDYQQTPNSIVWLVLGGGELLSCTYVDEHEIVAWARHSTESGRFLDTVVLPYNTRDEAWFAVKRGDNVYLERMDDTVDREAYHDHGHPYMSELETLSIDYGADQGGAQGKKKYVSRVMLRAMVATSCLVGSARGTEQMKELKFTYRTDTYDEQELLTDSGFDKRGRVYICVYGTNPFTLLSIQPEVAHGG